MFQVPSGFQGLLKEGGRHFAGVDEALINNISAARDIATITKSSFGPYGLNKLIVNHINKHFVTSDSAVMLQEMEVMHPAAKLLVMASKSQEQECGDGSNYCVVFAGELLSNALDLLNQGVHSADIIRGYELSLAVVLESLPSLQCVSISNIRDEKELSTFLKPVVAAKQYGLVNVIGSLVAKACVKSMAPRTSKKAAKIFDPDNIRVAKIVGNGDLSESQVVEGIAVLRDCMGSIKSKTGGAVKVAVFSCGLEMSGPEASGTVLFESAEQLMNFTKGEESKMEALIKALADAGVQAVIVGGAVQDIALHFCNKYQMLVLKITSKFELKRICRAINATPLVRLGAPLTDELGLADSIKVEEISSQRVTLISSPDSRIRSIVLRGATYNFLDEVERAIDDAVNLVRCLCANLPPDSSVEGRESSLFVAGGGASEIELASIVTKFGNEQCSGLEQYAVLKFAEALDGIPKALATNSGLPASETLAMLYAAHSRGAIRACVDIDGQGKSGKCLVVEDALTAGVFDHRDTKKWAIKLAMEAVLTILRVNHIIIAKQAGGPKAPPQGNQDDD